MELSEFYPPPDKLMKSELKILDYLRNDPFIKEKHSQFAQHAATYYNRYRSDNSRFEFFSYFDISHVAMHTYKGTNKQMRKGRPNLRLIVAALIDLNNGSYRNVTYRLSVCRYRSFAILRKFHFDIGIHNDETPARLQQHPQCHLQYCGEMLPDMVKMGCKEAQLEQMHPWLSEPRIFFWPMSLALLIDMALHEFPDETSKKFRARPEWRGLVRGQENLLLRPFYKKCVQVIDDAGERNKTLAEAFYVG